MPYLMCFKSTYGKTQTFFFLKFHHKLWHCNSTLCVQYSVSPELMSLLPEILFDLVRYCAEYKVNKDLHLKIVKIMEPLSIWRRVIHKVKEFCISSLSCWCLCTFHNVFCRYSGTLLIISPLTYSLILVHSMGSGPL